MSKRNVFLFGAGATLCWNSPTTCKLTELVRKIGFKTKDNKTYITEFIYQTLLANGYSEQDVNFETIISVIEELIVYYSKFNAEKKLPSLLSCFFSPVFEEELLNFSIKGGKQEHNYCLEIPVGVEYPFSKPSQHNETPEQFFFQHLLGDILSGISGDISKYAYHTKAHSCIDCDSDVSKLFVTWMNKLSTESDSVLRLYTLNYERIFKVLMERNGIHVFEGFDTAEYVETGRYLRPNVRRILSDFNCHIHYNLHGSAFWEVNDLDSQQLPNPELVLTYYPSLPENNAPTSYQVEKGKTLMVTNIVTGYQKAQKSMLTPFKQMQSSFDKDCCFADMIYIVGYSFSDEHINASLKSAVRFNPALKVVIVDPSFITNGMVLHLMITLFTFMDKAMEFEDREKVRDNLYSFYRNKFLVHTLTFKDFMEEQSKPQNKYFSFRN